MFPFVITVNFLANKVFLRGLLHNIHEGRAASQGQLGIRLKNAKDSLDPQAPRLFGLRIGLLSFGFRLARVNLGRTLPLTLPLNARDIPASKTRQSATFFLSVLQKKIEAKKKALNKKKESQNFHLPLHPLVSSRYPIPCSFHSTSFRFFVSCENSD